MKVLDATFLVDYLDGLEATVEFYEDKGGENERWVTPVPAYAEVLVGEGNVPDGDLTHPATKAVVDVEEYRS